MEQTTVTPRHAPDLPEFWSARVHLCPFGGITYRGVEGRRPRSIDGSNRRKQEMKTTTINWILLVGLVCLGTLRANADDANREGNRPARADVVATFDTDGDGKLDGDEQRAAGAARAAARQDSAGVGEDGGEKAVHRGGSKGANGKGRGRGKGRGGNGHGGAQGTNGHGGAKRTNGAGAEQVPDDDAAQVRDNAEGALPVDGEEPQDDENGARGRNGRGARLGKNGTGHARGQARRDGPEQER